MNNENYLTKQEIKFVLDPDKYLEGIYISESYYKQTNKLIIITFEDGSTNQMKIEIVNKKNKKRIYYNFIDIYDLKYIHLECLLAIIKRNLTGESSDKILTEIFKQIFIHKVNDSNGIHQEISKQLKIHFPKFFKYVRNLPFKLKKERKEWELKKEQEKLLSL